jgi:hypothetical protein
MKTIIRLLLVASLFFLLANEPPRQVKAVEVSKAQAPKVVVTTSVTPTAPAPKPVEPPVTVVHHSDDFYKEYIFSHESSNRLNAVNSIGCYGLGQDCNNALANECPNWQTDLDCQLRFWDKYAIRRYKSWANAYQFWVAHRWW